MAENKMEQVANLLGLELEEEFRIIGSPFIYEFTRCGLYHFSKTKNKWYFESDNTLSGLLTSDLIINKLPKQILDAKEKEYLSNVIKPFRDKVFTVSKQIYGDAHYIQIRMSTLYRNTVYEFFNLPSFKPETMYKGMQVGKEYTLEELGL